jgi:hypothetical protein
MKRLLPLDEALRQLSPELWEDYVAARAAAPFHRFRIFWLDVPQSAEQLEEAHRKRHREEAWARLEARLRKSLDRGERELWARRGDRMAKLAPVPVSAISALEFDDEEYTATGDGLPPLYDLQVELPPEPAASTGTVLASQAATVAGSGTSRSTGTGILVLQASTVSGRGTVATPAVPVKRWRKLPTAGAIKAAALAAAKTFQSNDPPTESDWKKALEAKLGEEVTIRLARKALSDWAPHLKRRRGQIRNRRQKRNHGQKRNRGS